MFKLDQFIKFLMKPITFLLFLCHLCRYYSQEEVPAKMININFPPPIDEGNHVLLEDSHLFLSRPSLTIETINSFSTNEDSILFGPLQGYSNCTLTTLSFSFTRNGLGSKHINEETNEGRNLNNNNEVIELYCTRKNSTTISTKEERKESTKRGTNSTVDFGLRRRYLKMALENYIPLPLMNECDYNISEALSFSFEETETDRWIRETSSTLFEMNIMILQSDMIAIDNKSIIEQPIIHGLLFDLDIDNFTERKGEGNSTSIVSYLSIDTISFFLSELSSVLARQNYDILLLGVKDNEIFQTHASNAPGSKVEKVKPRYNTNQLYNKYTEKNDETWITLSSRISFFPIVVSLKCKYMAQYYFKALSHPNMQISGINAEYMVELFISQRFRNPDMKICIFGIGFDSPLWKYVTYDKTFFIENNMEFIELAMNAVDPLRRISESKIIQYSYDAVTVEGSLRFVDRYLSIRGQNNQENEERKVGEDKIQIQNAEAEWKTLLNRDFPPPSALVQNGPFDIVLIDGPIGTPIGIGRLLPIYWTSAFLCKENALVLVDDSERELEYKSMILSFNITLPYVFEDNPNRKLLLIIEKIGDKYIPPQ